MLNFLDNPRIWSFFRNTIEMFFHLYKIHVRTIQSFGINEKMSILDLGCGIGQYRNITNSKYLGIDTNKRYIEAAKKISKNEKKEFMCNDVNNYDLKKSQSSFDAALLIDFIHHLSDSENEKLMKKLSVSSLKAIIFSDPVIQTNDNFLGRFLTHLDRGGYIRTKENYLKMISHHLIIEKMIPLKIMWIEGLCILARPKRQKPN